MAVGPGRFARIPGIAGPVCLFALLTMSMYGCAGPATGKDQASDGAATSLDAESDDNPPLVESLTEHQVLETEAEAAAPEANQTDPSAWTPGDVFLAAGTRPEDAFSLVPIAVPGAGAGPYPLLVVHTEDLAWDADSVFRFLARYPTTRVLTLGLPGGLANALDERGYRVVDLSQPGALLDHWVTVAELAYAPATGEMPALASFWAARVQAPLVIAGGALDEPGTFLGRRVLLFGDVECPETAATCTIVAANAEEFRQAALASWPDLCERLLVFDPHDTEWSSTGTGRLVTEVGRFTLSRLFRGMSAIAPYLAAARDELLVPVTPSSPVDVEDAIRDVAKACLARGDPPRALTIVAGPKDIPLQSFNGVIREENDLHRYGNLDDDLFPELAVGRVFGYTVSDASCLAARSLFSGALGAPQSALVVWPKDILFHRGEAAYIAERLSAAGLPVEEWYADGGFDATRLSNVGLYFNFSHGLPSGFAKVLSVDDLAGLDLPSMVVGAASCNSCDVEAVLGTESPRLMCLEFVRHGAVAYVGGSDTVQNGYNDQALFMNGLLAGEGVGEAYRKALRVGIMREIVWSQVLGIEAMRAFFTQFVVGDPLFSPLEARPDLLPAPPVVDWIDPGHLRARVALDREVALEDEPIPGGRIFLGPFGTAVMRARFLQPPLPGNENPEFGDDLVFVLDLEWPDASKTAAIDHATVAVEGGPVEPLLSMPLITSPWFETCPLAKCTEARIDLGWGSLRPRALVAVFERFGGDPPLTVTEKTLPAREYEFVLTVENPEP